MTGTTVEVETYRSPSKRFGLFHSRDARNVSDSDLLSLANKMVESVSEDEKEHAARASFKYLWRSVREELSKELREERDRCATAMALRHLSSKKGNFDVALLKFRNAIKFRRDYDLDGLRLCFHASELKLDETTNQKYAIYREHLEDRMSSGRVYVSGYDKCNRAIYTIYAARNKDFEREWFLKESLYNFERAIAATERESGGIEDVITIIGNYNGFSSKHSAPMSVSHEFMDCLRQNYPGRVKRVYLLNTPTTFMFFWSLVKPFIASETRKKIQFVNSERQREKEFGDLVASDQAAPWMLSGGKKAREFNANEYLNDTPFNQAFD